MTRERLFLLIGLAVVVLIALSIGLIGYFVAGAIRGDRVLALTAACACVICACGGYSLGLLHADWNHTKTLRAALEQRT